MSYGSYDRGGELVLWPGLLTQVVFNGVLLAIPSGDDYYSLPSRVYLVFNVTFYASIIFGLLLLVGQNSVKKGESTDPFDQNSRCNPVVLMNAI